MGAIFTIDFLFEQTDLAIYPIHITDSVSKSKIVCSGALGLDVMLRYFWFHQAGLWFVRQVEGALGRFRVRQAGRVFIRHVEGSSGRSRVPQAG